VKESKLREEEIYDWLTKANDQTNHIGNPLGFAVELKAVAQDYAHFAKGQNRLGEYEHGLHNIWAVGGSAIRQHNILLLAGRRLSPELFTRLCIGVEEVMCVWLISGVPTKDYERAITQGARLLRAVKSEADFIAFQKGFIDAQKAAYRDQFVAALRILKTSDLRQFRMKYLIAKVTQHFDILAYGEPGNDRLENYLVSKNEVEHVLAVGATDDAKTEFGEGAEDSTLIQSLGNLVLLEKSVNIVASNAPYSAKAKVYPSSKFLLTRCQCDPLMVGINDQITKAVNKLAPAAQWSSESIHARQNWYADAALDVWKLRNVGQELEPAETLTEQEAQLG
jgi:hypothetical protein